MTDARRLLAHWQTADVKAVVRRYVDVDPQGAIFATYRSASAAPMPEAPPEIGDCSWHELATTDHGAALTFYEAVYGWQEAGTHDMGPMGIYRMFGRGGRPLGGMFNKPAEMPAPPHWLLYARVDDVLEPLSPPGRVIDARRPTPRG